MLNNLSNEKFGYYKPGRSTILLRALTKSGVARGTIRKWISRKWVKMGYSFVDATIRGVNYRLDLRDNTTDTKILSSSKFYDGKEIEYLADAAAGVTDSVFVDVGANTGYYSLNLARLGYARVIAIEPNPSTQKRLLFNIEANNMGQEIMLVPLCIGDGEDVPFYSSGDLGSASVFPDSHRSAEPIMVPTKPLLDILNDQNVIHVDGLKIDIEGYEDRCLFPFYESAPKTLWPRVVVIEFCNRDLWERDVLEKMRNIGYQEIYESRGNKVFKLK